MENNEKDKAVTSPSGGQDVPHYNWGENCDGWTFVDSADMSVKQEKMPPGTSELMHYHEKATQFFFILKRHGHFYY